MRWRGLTLQLFFLVILPITVILLLVTFGSLSLHQRAMRTLVGERDERAARTAASAINEQLNHRAATVRSLAIRAGDNISPNEILETSEFLQPDFDVGLAFFSPTGNLLEASGDTSFWKSLQEKENSILNEYLAQKDNRPTFSPSFKHPFQDESIILVATSADSESPIIVGAFSPASIVRRALTGAFNPGEQAKAYIVSPEEEILYQIGDFESGENPGDHTGVGEGLRGESGTTYVQVGGNEHVIAFSPVSTTGWALVIEEPWEAVTNPLLNTTQLAPLVLVPVLILALVALWFGARQIVQPLQSLEARAADLAWGNYEAIEDPVGGIEEIRRLQRTLIHLALKIQSAQKSLRGYIGAITQGQEEERRRLARELHDETIQDLIALNQRIQMARLSLDEGSTEEQLTEIQKMTEQSIQELRRFTRALRPLYLEDLGLVTALDMLAKETSQTNNIQIEFQLRGNEIRLSPETEIALYRMAQEGLTNIVRHSQAKNAYINLRYIQNEVKLTLTDDGCGFEVPESPGEFAPSGHYGLLGLHERAELIGANLEIHSSPGKGTRLIITLPIKVGKV